MDNKKKFAMKLKIKIIKFCINQKEFAEIAGISYATFRLYTAGIRAPSKANLEKINNALTFLAKK